MIPAPKLSIDTADTCSSACQLNPVQIISAPRWEEMRSKRVKLWEIDSKRYTKRGSKCLMHPANHKKLRIKAINHVHQLSNF